MNQKHPSLIRRKRHKGANLAILCGVALLMLGFMGICIYTGLQAFMEGDLQRTAMNSAMAGASRLYSGVGASGKPTLNAGNATGYARSTFEGIVGNGSLGGFGATIVNVTANNANDSITVEARARVNSVLLSPIGIKEIEVNSTATARAVKYEPTAFTGPIEIEPDGTTLASYSRILELAFPLTDGEGTDLYVEQPAEAQQGYVVEACNQETCYNLVDAATPVGTSQILAGPGGERLIYGTATFDLSKVGVNKATRLRFTHGGNFEEPYYNAGAETEYDETELPLTIRRVMIFNHSSACVEASNCPIPAGFAPVE